MPTGWLIPVTDPPRGVRTVRVCHECERADAFLRGITKADAGVHATPTSRWTRTEIDTCDHPNHEHESNAAGGNSRQGACTPPAGRRRRGLTRRP